MSEIKTTINRGFAKGDIVTTNGKLYKVTKIYNEHSLEMKKLNFLMNIYMRFKIWFILKWTRFILSRGL